MCRFFWRSEASDTFGLELGNCELLVVGAGNSPKALCKSSVHFYLPSLALSLLPRS